MGIKLKLSLAQVPVTLEDGNGEGEYYLKEMVAAKRDQYLDTVSDRVRIDAKGRPVGIKKFEGMHADLLCRCLYYADGPNKDKAVDKKVIQEWPAATTSVLYKEAQTLNKLVEDEKGAAESEDEAKNG